MLFFFAGGVTQQVRQVIKSNAGRCINCNSPADLVDSEKVLKLFFVPVWRWPAKDPPVLHCGTCGLFFPPTPTHCGFCSREVVDPRFSFCPFCGSQL